MKSLLEFRYNDCNDTIEVLYKSCEELDNYLHSRVEPKNRTWSKGASCWVVTPDVIESITAVGSTHFDEIKYFSLPPHLQEKVKKFISGPRSKKKKEEAPKSINYFDRLYLKSNAPSFVVKAAYKALLAYYHPDKETGNKEKFLEISEAYSNIKVS